MPSFSQALNPLGEAFVRVEVSVNALTARARQRAGHGPSPVFAVVGLIDTGSGITCVDPAIIGALGISAVDSISANPVGAAPGQVLDVYAVGLAIKHPNGNPNDDLARRVWRVAELPVRHTGADVIIGCDLLRHCELHYDGRRGRFALDY